MEFTLLSDIRTAVALRALSRQGRLCNCDDLRQNFFTYFSPNFAALRKKKLGTTCFKNQQMDCSASNAERAIYLEYDGTVNENGVPSIEEIIHHLQGDGDFRKE